MSAPLMLDLFCGEGGAGMGYARAGFKVVGVDNDPAMLERYPFECHEADALEFAIRHGHKFKIGHGSPTCTGYSRCSAAMPDRFTRYDRLIKATRETFKAVGIPYVIENVADARRELVKPVLLCGRMFGLTATDVDGTPLTLDRHRLFESSIPIKAPPHTKHEPHWQVAGAYGGARRDKREARYVRKGGYVPKDLDVIRALLRTEWMSERGCFRAIPPVYTLRLGRQLIAALDGGAT